MTTVTYPKEQDRDMTPANIADLQRLWSHLDVWQEQAKACTTATVTVTLSIHPGGRGASATLSLVSDKTGGHDVHEPVNHVEEIEHACKRFAAHFAGFMESQPKVEAVPLVNAAQLTWGVKLDTFTGPAVWGTRAILDQRGARPLVDILWDRQADAGTSAAKTALHARLNGDDGKPGALPAFREAVSDDRIEDSDDRVEQAVINGVEFAYRMAGGYCYISARLTDLADTVKPAKRSRKVVR